MSLILSCVHSSPVSFRFIREFCCRLVYRCGIIIVVTMGLLSALGMVHFVLLFRLDRFLFLSSLETIIDMNRRIGYLSLPPGELVEYLQT